MYLPHAPGSPWRTSRHRPGHDLQRAGRQLDVRPLASSQGDGGRKARRAGVAQAALLTGFSQFSPLDGIPAADSTEVFVWYSPDAVYFGIRAFEAARAVHATLADRDKIGADDNVQILLEHIRRSSAGHGARGQSLRRADGRGAGRDRLHQRQRVQHRGVRREAADLSPDIVFESKGRLTDYGYEVEVRVPFKSLSFQPAKEQRWGINVTRQVQHSGQEDSWVPAKRASASFLAQSGHLVGLTELQRGLVLDVNPRSPEDDRRAGPAGGTTPEGAPSWVAACAGESPTISTSTARRIPTSPRWSPTPGSSCSIRAMSCSSRRSARSFSMAASSSTSPTT